MDEQRPTPLYSAEYWKWYRRKNGDKLRAYKRKYDHERYLTHTETEHARRKKWQSKNPEKTKAHKAVFLAIQQGILTRKPCEMCGTSQVVAHHDDYTKPLEVKWLCQKDHIFLHSLTSYNVKN